MRYHRTYIQYGDLVFDDVYADASAATFKTFETEYGSSHGSYFPQKRKGGLLRASSVTMTLTWRMRMLPCEVRPFWPGHVKSELSTQGKLWAVQNGTLLWAHAYLTSFYDRTNSFLDTYEVDVEFYLPEGVWHKADKQRTFLVPYDPCDGCHDFQEIRPCLDQGCCNCGPEPVEHCDCCECLEKEQALCYHLDEIKDFNCHADFKVVYDCDAAEKYFSDFLSDERMGQKFCGLCGDPIVGQLYSETDIPTDGVKFTLMGEFKNPYIEVNGNGNYIKGEYNGVLEIYGDGQAYFGTCEACEPLEVSAWVIPQGMSYGWTIEPGKNRLLIDGGCCGTNCAWVEMDNLSF